MKIGIISDVHDNWINLEKVVSVFNEEGFKYIFMAGDLISPSGLELLAAFKGDAYLVFGNNEGEKVGFGNKLNNYAILNLFSYKPDITSVNNTSMINPGALGSPTQPTFAIFNTESKKGEIVNLN